MLRSLTLSAVFLALAASAPVASRDRLHRTDAERLDADLVGLTPGKPVDCIGLRTARTSSGYGDTIVYAVSRNLKYRNDTGGGCRGVGRDDILVTVTPSTQLCRGDIAQTVDRVTKFPSGSCALGAFIPYTRQ